MQMLGAALVMAGLAVNVFGGHSRVGLCPSRARFPCATAGSALRHAAAEHYVIRLFASGGFAAK